MSLSDKIKTIIGGAVSGGDVLASSKLEITPLTSIVYQKEQGSKLMNDLIKKEVTEEVKQLRYRTYWVEEESYKYGVNSQGQTFHIYPEFTKPNVFEEEGKRVLLVQNTEPISSGVDNNVQIQKEGVKFKQYYPLLLIRDDTFPKFQFEKFCKQVVLKECENSYQLDLYMNIVPSTDDRLERNLTLDLEKVFNKILKIDYLDDFTTIEFTTKNSWGSQNHIRNKFKVICNTGINKFSSFYVLSYKVNLIEQENMISKYYNENISKEYENKAKRPNMNVPFDIFHGVPSGTNSIEICDRCGREMKELERADYRLTKQEYGIGMCVLCLNTYLISK